MKPNRRNANLVLAVLATLAPACRTTAEVAAPPRHLPYPGFDLPDDPAPDGALQEPIELDEASGLDELVRHALRANPGLESARQRWIAALEQVPQVSTLPDPVVSARYFIEEVETRVGPQEWALGLSQRLPWFGKLSLAEDVATLQAETAFVVYQAEALSVMQEVKTAWYELFFLERSTETVRENLDLLRDLNRVVTSRFSTGEVDYADVLRAQVELGRLEDKLHGLEDRRRPMAARLNAALHRSPAASVPRPTSLTDEDAIAGTEALRDEMHTWNPELRALRSELSAARKNVDLAGLARRPDFTVGLEYIYTDDAVGPGVPGSGDDPILATLSFNLPLSSRRYGAIERGARARQRALAEKIASEIDRLQTKLETLLFDARDAERQITLYRDTLVPRARQTYEATETAYRADKASFLDLIDAERLRLEFELSLERARTDRSLAIARLERLVGAPVTEGTELEEKLRGEER